jgi:hypothetical protein
MASVHVIVAPVPIGDGQPQLIDPPGGGIAVVARVAHRLDELIDDVLRGREVRVPHPQVDDILPLPAGLDLQRIYLGEDIGR